MNPPHPALRADLPLQGGGYWSMLSNLTTRQVEMHFQIFPDSSARRRESKSDSHLDPHLLRRDDEFTVLY